MSQYLKYRVTPHHVNYGFQPACQGLNYHLKKIEAGKIIPKRQE
jgi:hypothetical protein